MDTPPGPPYLDSTMPQLRLIHIALCLGSAVIATMFGAMHFLMPDTAVQIPSVVPWTFLGLSVLMVLGAAAFRNTIEPADTAGSVDEWQTRNRGKAIVLWALCEGGVVLAALAFFFGVNPMFAGVLAAGGLGFLASQSPGTLAGH